MSGNESRLPHNLQGLLRFCVENTQNEDVQNPVFNQPMTAERRQWLQEAIESLTASDPIKVMLEDIKVLLDPDNSVEAVEMKEVALDELEMYTENLDIANDFHKIGGFSLLADLLQSQHVGLRSRTANLIATLTQNNPYCQEAVVEMNLLPMLMHKVDDLTEMDQVRVKCLYAVSCVVRDSDVALQLFLAKDGLSLLLKSLQSNLEKLQMKAIFMMSHLCSQNTEISATLCQMGIVEQIITQLDHTHTGLHEHLTMTLLKLVSQSAAAYQECLKPELHLQQLLIDRHHLLQGKEEFQDELQYVDQLFDICFKEDKVAVDR